MGSAAKQSPFPEDSCRTGAEDNLLEPSHKSPSCSDGLRRLLALRNQVAATLQIPSDLNYGKLRLHPFWDPLRGDPRFEKLVASLAPKSTNK